MDQLPVTTLHVFAIALCAIGFAFDTMEMLLGGALSAVFSTPPQVASARELSLLLASVFVGAAVGSPLLGAIADRHGRRKTLMGALLWLTLTSLGAAASNGLAALTVARALSGVALGAYPPVVIAYLTDLLPPRRRGTLIFVMSAVGFTGPPAGMFLLRWLTPIQPLGFDGWRWVFVFGGVGAAIVGAVFIALPESPRWLAARGDHARAEATYARFARAAAVVQARSQTEIAAPAATDRADDRADDSAQGRFSLVAVLFALSAWSTSGLPVVVGAILSQKGFKLTDTFLFLGVSTLGPMVGLLATSLGVDRVERRVALAIMAGAMAVSGAWFVATNAPALLVAMNAVFYMSAAIYLPAMNVYGAELLPTRTRATSIAGAWALNRAGAAAAPFVLVPVLRSAGAVVMFGVIAATLLGSIAMLAISPKGRQRRPVA
jgi:putative MFS transporter